MPVCVYVCACMRLFYRYVAYIHTYIYTRAPKIAITCCTIGLRMFITYTYTIYIYHIHIPYTYTQNSNYMLYNWPANVLGSVTRGAVHASQG